MHKKTNKNNDGKAKKSERLRKLERKKEKLDEKARKKHERRLRKLQRKWKNKPKRNIWVKKHGGGKNKEIDREKEYSLHLIDKMIQVEREVAESFGKPIHFSKTEHYKSLSDKEKEDFKKYMKKKSLRKNFLLIFALLFGGGCIISSGFVGLPATGAVIATTGGKIKSLLVGNVFISLLGLLVLIVSVTLGIVFVVRKKFK